MKKVGKRLLAMLSAAMLLAIPLSESVWADPDVGYINEGYTWNISDGMGISGAEELYAASIISGEALTMTIDGVPLAVSPDAPTVTMNYVGGDGSSTDRDIKTDTYYAANNQVGLNGQYVSPLFSDGTLGIHFDATTFLDGDNKVYIDIGGYEGLAPYDESKAHGFAAQGGDKDDFLISQLAFTMPDGSVRTPDYLVTHKGKEVGSMERVIETIDPYPYTAETTFWMGDGWGTYETWAGNPDPRFDIPYMIDLGLNYQKPQVEHLFSLDTATLQEGYHTIALLSGSTEVASATVIYDDSAPSITTSLQNYQQITADMSLDIHFVDPASGMKEQTVYLENELVGSTADVTVPFTGKENGLYAVTMFASDNSGNTVRRTLYVRVADTATPSFSMSGALSITPDVDSTVTLSEAAILPYSAGYGATENGIPPIVAQSAYDEWCHYQMTYGTGEAISNLSSAGIPYQLFTVSLEGRTDGMVTLAYEGSTVENERLAMKLWNPQTNTWDKISTLVGSGKMSAQADAAVYGSDDKLIAMVQPDYTTNGSDTLFWTTDPQHYSHFEDLNAFYEKIYQYASDSYNDGDIGYLIQTGDVIDQYSIMSEWEVASRCHKIADDAGLPYGVVTGNHDTTNYPSADYTNFWKYFPASRYNQNDWYGGSLQNNQSHFDLVTVGNVDFLFLYLGYGVEGTDETIAWANQVLQAYPNRNAVICTHQYIKNSIAAWYSNSRAEVIFNKIIVPNDNVKMVLCGHDDGSQVLQKQIGSDRVVYELLSDYQFVEEQSLEFYNGHTHYIGNVPKCNGDGYIREMVISGNTLTNHTFSPITGGTNAFGNRENFSIDIDFNAPTRKISTTSFSAYVAGAAYLVKDAAAGETVTLPSESVISACAASVATAAGTAYSSAYAISVPTPPDKPIHNPLTPDYAALVSLVDYVQTLNEEIYTADSWQALQAGLAKAQDVIDDPEEENDTISETYQMLNALVGKLKVKSADNIDPSELVSLYNYSFDMSQWRDEAGHFLNSAASYLNATQNENGSLTLSRSDKAPNTWPSMKALATNIKLKPTYGKVYVNLDVDAHSSWTIYLYVSQGSKSSQIRLNYAIDQFKDKSADSSAGVYRGYYDVSEAFSDAGFDMTKEITISKTYLFVVPGELTWAHLEFLTALEHYARGDMNDDRIVNMSDLSILYQYVADIAPFTDERQMGAGDISGRGQVDMQDALRLYQYACGVSGVL